MAAAGAAVGPAAARGSRPLALRARRRGTRRARRPAPAGTAGLSGARAGGSRLAFAAVAAVMVLAVGGGFALLAGLWTPGHPRPGASPSPHAPGSGKPSPASPGAAPVKAMPSGPPSGRPSPAPRPRGPAAWREVTGVGCAHHHDDGVILHSAPAGPGWQIAGGGWTGDGCDGSTAWTMDPSGRPAPSVVTWRFSPPKVSRCTVAVFIPRLNALGVSEYAVFTGSPVPGQAVAAVRVSQAGAAGQWLTLGTFPVQSPRLEITAAPVPVASGPGHHGAIAASAARARCS